MAPHHTTPHCLLPTGVWRNTAGSPLPAARRSMACTEESRLPKCRSRQCPTRAWRRIGLGPARTSVAPSGRAVQRPQSSPGQPPRPRCATHYTQRALRHTALPFCILPCARHPGHCHLVTAPSAHHTTPHHTTRQCNTALHSTPQQSTAHHITSQYSTAQHSTAQHIMHNAEKPEGPSPLPALFVFKGGWRCCRCGA